MLEEILRSIGIEPNFFNVLISLFLVFFIVPIVVIILEVLWYEVLPNILLFLNKNKIFFLFLLFLLVLLVILVVYMYT